MLLYDDAQTAFGNIVLRSFYIKILIEGFLIVFLAGYAFNDGQARFLLRQRIPSAMVQFPNWDVVCQKANCCPKLNINNLLETKIVWFTFSISMVSFLQDENHRNVGAEKGITFMYVHPPLGFKKSDRTLRSSHG